MIFGNRQQHRFLRIFQPYNFINFITFLTLFVPASGFATDWQEEKGDHFIIYYQKDEPLIKEIKHKAEQYYTQIADDLGYARYSNFWQWERRAKIYVYPSLEEFQSQTGEKGWSHGLAVYSKREIYTYSAHEGFLDGILPHEITHLIFRDFVGLEGQVPVWLDEGIAQWEEPEKRKLARKVARWLVQHDKDYHLQDLTATDVRKLTDQMQVNYFYMQSVSVVDYLIRNFGGQRFTQFCRELRDGKKFNDALQAVYPSIESIYVLDMRWRDDVMKEESNLEIRFNDK